MKLNKNILSTLMAIFIAMVFVSSILGFIYTYDYADTLKFELDQRDRLIESLNRRDSIMQGILHHRQSTDSILRGGNVISTGELVKYANDLSSEISQLYDKINKINDSLLYYKIYYGYNQRAFNHTFTVVPNASGGRTFSFNPNAVSKEEHNQCLERTSLQAKELFQLKTKVLELESELVRHKRVLQWYKIDINERPENGILYPSPYNAPMLDSALMLLPVYRNNLKYDSSKNQWSIGNRSVISITRGEVILNNDRDENTTTNIE